MALHYDEEESSTSTTEHLDLSTNDTLIAKIYDNRGYPGFKNIIVFDLQNTKCPSSHREIVKAWNGKETVHLPYLQVNGKPCSSNTYIFPNDPGGKPGLIQVKTQYGNAPEKLVLLRKLANGHFIPTEK